MIPRPYQSKSIDNAITALKKHGNSLCVAPTGSGKSLMIGMLVDQLNPIRSLILGHRDEIVFQNINKFSLINPGKTVSICNADSKDFAGEAVFAMVQTLHRDNHLGQIPNDIELMVIDEAHHVSAKTYLKIIKAVRDVNPSCAVAGFTATPSRGDGRGLGRIFDNVSVNISIAELIAKGFLVPPKAMMFNLADDDLLQVKKSRTTHEFDMDDVSSILNTQAANAEIIRQWQKICPDRQTIIFCSNVAHAESVTAAFADAGISSAMVTGTTPKEERKGILEKYEKKEIQVLVNIFVFSEGFDSPITSCIVLLRPCSYKSTMIQMIGRGLRPVPFEDYPDVIKKDCVVLDFGASLRVHGDLYLDVDLSDIEKREQPDYKVCPGCLGEIPYKSRICDLCGYEFKREAKEEKEIVENGVMVPLDLLLGESPFKWIPLFDSNRILMASGFSCFACVATKDDENFYAFGKNKNGDMNVLGITNRVNAIVLADDFLRKVETSESAKKSRRWMQDPCSPRQAELLKQIGHDVIFDVLGMSNYNKIQATALLNFSWHRGFIEQALQI